MNKQENKKSILVTGAAGFIGFHLTQLLLKSGYKVIGLDNINDYYDVSLKYGRLEILGISKDTVTHGVVVESANRNGFHFLKLDLTERNALQQLFIDHEIKYVCNLAAQAGVRYSLKNPYTYIESNIVGYLNLLECARYNKIKHFVYASSSSVYGLNTKMPLSTEDNVDHPISLYAATKKSNELMAHSYSHLYNLPTTGLRFFTVYGPWGRPDMALFLFTKAIIEGEPINIFNHGKMIRDFTYVSDIVEGVKRVIENAPIMNEAWTKENGISKSSAPYKIYNIGNNNPVDLMDFISEIEKQIGKEAKKNFLGMQDGDVAKTQADVTDLGEDLDYKPDTTIQQGIEKFLAWYLNFYQ